MTTSAHPAAAAHRCNELASSQPPYALLCSGWRAAGAGAAQRRLRSARRRGGSERGVRSARPAAPVQCVRPRPPALRPPRPAQRHRCVFFGTARGTARGATYIAMRMPRLSVPPRLQQRLCLNSSGGWLSWGATRASPVLCSPTCRLPRGFSVAGAAGVSSHSHRLGEHEPSGGHPQPAVGGVQGPT